MITVSNFFDFNAYPHICIAEFAVLLCFVQTQNCTFALTVVFNFIGKRIKLGPVIVGNVDFFF